MRLPTGLLPRLAIALVIALAVALVVYLNVVFPGTLDDPDNLTNIAIKLGWIALLGSSAVLMVMRQRLSHTLLSLLIWLVIGLAAVIGYTYKDALRDVTDRVTAGLLPGEPRLLQPGVVALQAGSGGHFRSLAEVNGKRVQFMVDTGASAVTLTYDDAKRVGVDVAALNYNIPVSTANGVAMSAGVRLDSLQIGDIVLDNVAASVAQPGRLSQSLLGMNALRRLSSFEIRGDELILRR